MYNNSNIITGIRPLENLNDQFAIACGISEAFEQYMNASGGLLVGKNVNQFQPNPGVNMASIS